MSQCAGAPVCSLPPLKVSPHPHHLQSFNKTQTLAGGIYIIYQPDLLVLRIFIIRVGGGYGRREHDISG